MAVALPQQVPTLTLQVKTMHNHAQTGLWISTNIDVTIATTAYYYYCILLLLHTTTTAYYYYCILVLLLLHIVIQG